MSDAKTAKEIEVMPDGQVWVTHEMVVEGAEEFLRLAEMEADTWSLVREVYTAIDAARLAATAPDQTGD